VAQWVIEGDIKACFDEIAHEWLLAHIPMDKHILNEFLKAGYVYERRLFPYIDTDYFHRRQYRLLVNRNLGLKLPDTESKAKTGSRPADGCLSEA
jgi:hypothetical protein